MKPLGPPVGVVGKLPTRTDYARLGECGPGIVQLLDWMLEGCETVRPPRVGGRVQAFARPSAAGSIAGVLAPSRDAAGRLFPLAAAAPLALEQYADCPQLLPLLLERVWSDAESLLLHLLAGERLDGPWQASPIGDPAGARRTYETWLRTMAMGDWMEMVFERDASRAGRALATLDAAVAPHAGQQCPDTPLCLSFPLGRAGGAAVCFWLHLLGVLLSPPSFVPSFFWSHRGERGRLIVPLGSPAPELLGILWSASDRDCVCPIDAFDPGWQPPGVVRWREHLSAARSLGDLVARVARSTLSRPVPFWARWRSR